MIGIIVGGILVIALCAWALWWFLKRSRARKAKLNGDTNLESELPAGGHQEKTELPASSHQAIELQGSQQRTREQIEAKELSSVSTRSRNNSSTRQTTDSATNGSAQPAQPLNAATIVSPAELSWDHCRYELEGSDVPELRTDRSSRRLEHSPLKQDPDATAHLVAGNISLQPSAPTSSRTGASKPLKSIQEKILSQLKERRKSVKRKEQQRQTPEEQEGEAPAEEVIAGPSEGQPRRVIDEKAPGTN